ncbi:unnamed protein product [Caretta caretta]
MQQVLDDVPNQDIKLMTNDFNAQIGINCTGSKGVMGSAREGIPTDNDWRFLNLCSTCTLKIGVHLFKNKRIHMEITK